MVVSEYWRFDFEYHVISRPDMTFAVDWALNNNYLSIMLYFNKSLKKNRIETALKNGILLI